MFFPRFHLFHHIVDTIPVRVEYVRTKIRFVQRREKVLWHHPHDDEGDDEKCYHRTQRQHLTADQRPENRSKLMIERLVIWVFCIAVRLGFQDKITEYGRLCQCKYPTQSQRNGEYHKQRLHDFRYRSRGQIKWQE